MCFCSQGQIKFAWLSKKSLNLQMLTLYKGMWKNSVLKLQDWIFPFGFQMTVDQSMDIFCIMLVNNEYMDIFQSSFAFFFWNKTLSDCRAFQVREKVLHEKPGNFPPPTLPLIFIRSNYFVKLVWLPRGYNLYCIHWLIKVR